MVTGKGVRRERQNQSKTNKKRHTYTHSHTSCTHPNDPVNVLVGLGLRQSAAGWQFYHLNEILTWESHKSFEFQHNHL